MSKQLKTAVNISCNERAAQYPKGTLHADGGKLFCSTCNVTLDHTRKGTIDRHLDIPSHVAKRKLIEEAAERVSKKQATISGVFRRMTDARDSRNVVHFELVEAFTAANIPLNKLDHPKLNAYLKTNIANMGSLPSSQQLRCHYLPKVFDIHKQELLAKIATATSLSVVTDEASDSQDRFVLHILFILPVSDADQIHMDVITAALVYLDKVNATTVSQAIINVLTSEYNIDLNKVSACITDNATYMSAAYAKFSGLLPNCVHITCNAHILNLVGETLRKNFPTVDRLVASFKAIFTHSASRKQRYKEYIGDKTNAEPEQVPLPPVPVLTRWNSWFNAVSHHAKYIDNYAGFIEAELEQSAVTNALTELVTLLADPLTTEYVRFIADATAPLVSLLTWFENRQPTIHLAYNRIMDLLASFLDKATDGNLAEWQKAACRDAAVKLQQYYSSEDAHMSRQQARFTQPGLAFMKSVRLFDPRQAKTLAFPDDLTHSLPSYDSKRGRDELAAYKLAVVEVAADVKPLTFWFANMDRFPYLSHLAVRCLSVPGNSVDAERSVSQYTQINAPQRQGFSDDNLAKSVMFAFNAKNS